jgi:CNT family concentrative nucleoside transporter
MKKRPASVMKLIAGKADRAAAPHVLFPKTGLKSQFWGLLLLCTLGPLSLVQAQSELARRWHFQAITNLAGDSLLPIDSSDYLLMRPDGTFHYELAAKDSLLAAGTYRRVGDSLIYRYRLPTDTQRIYTLQQLTDSVLLLQEGQVRFHFGLAPPAETSPTAGALPLQYDFKNREFTWANIGRGLLGMAVLLFIAFLLSSHRRSINWALVAKGLVIQVAFALAILKFPPARSAFDALSSFFVTLLSFASDGAEFLFGSLITDTDSLGYIFAFQVLPTVIFFSALTGLLFYYRILQRVVYGFAWFMRRTLSLSGAESLAAAGNIFLGQTESPLLVKPYIQKMTRSELLCLMSGGMATIAGGVLAAYIGFLGGEDPLQQAFFAKHLLAASLMSAPAAVVAAKILVPETKTVNQDMKLEKQNLGSNALDAITNGTTDGLRLAVNVGAMLLVFIALIALANALLEDGIGSWTGLNAWVQELTNGQYQGLSLQFILGYSLAPLTWLMGVSSADVVLVGQLLGEKTILNEFVAYVSLGEMVEAGRFSDEKSIIIATYILCGFANFASIGIQIGGIGALAPSRRSELSALGVRALIAGTLACLFTAVIVGMLI